VLSLTREGEAALGACKGNWGTASTEAHKTDPRDNKSFMEAIASPKIKRSSFQHAIPDLDARG
jgi:hypothetical protein